MRKIILLALLSVLTINLFSQVNHRRVRFTYNRSQIWQTLPGIIHVPAGYRDSTTKKFPLIIFLHGAGEAGATDGSQLTKLTTIENASVPYTIAQGNWPDSFQVNGVWHHPLVFSPQFPGWSANGQQTEALIDWAITNYSIDTTRIYVTGLSAGGEGTINYSAKTISNTNGSNLPQFATANRPAAIVPMAQAIQANNWKAQVIVGDNIPAWGFGDPAGDTHGASEQLQMTYIVNNGGFGRFTSYTGGHCCFLQFYLPTYKETFTYKGVSKSRNVYEWMLENQRVASVNPIVGAGTDQVINLPTSSVSLSSTVNPGASATLTSVQWTKTSGPVAGTITSPTSQSTTVTGLTAGTYIFRLTATNSNSLTGYDEVQITVNDLDPILTVNSPSITLPTSTAALTSTPVTNYTVITRSWTKFKTTSQPILKLTVVGSSTAGGTGTTNPDSSFVNKVKKFYVDNGILSTVTNQAIGGTSVFDVNITAAMNTTPHVLLVNYPTNAYNGSTYTVTQIAQQYQKIKDSCDARGVIFYTTGTQPRDEFNTTDRAKLKTLNDTLRLRFPSNFIDFYTPLVVAADNSIKPEFTYGDQIHVNNNAHRHLAEVVKAANIFKSLITTAYNISSPSSQNTNVTGLTAGTHYVQHSVTDSRGYSATAISTITVIPSSQQAPTASAGTDQSITLPTSTVTLTGSGNDPDGTISSYLWTQVSGPNTADIISSTAASTVVNGLIQGVYVFNLRVTDNDNLTGNDQITVTVNAQASLPTLTKVGATEYSTYWLYSDGVVRAYIFNNTTNKVQITPLNIGGRTAVDVGIGFNRPLVRDDQGYIWVGTQGSANPTRVDLDTTGAAFNNNIAVQGYFFDYTTIRSDGSIWYWGADGYNLYAGSNPITKPIKLSPNGVVFTKVHMGKTIMALTNTGVVYQWFKDGSLTATQKTFVRPAIDIFGGHADFYGVIIPDAGQPTTSGYPYVWGTSFGHWGGTTSFGSTATSVKTLWGMTVPIKKIECNHMTIAYLDTTGKLYTVGYNANGELGVGVELVNQAENYPTPYNWSQGLEDPFPGARWIRQDKRFRDIYSSNTFTFYWWAVDSAGVGYHWGRTKSFVGGDGKTWTGEDPYPNAYDVLTPTEQNPLINTPAVSRGTFVPYTLNAGSDITTTNSTITLSAVGTPSTGYEITSWLWVIQSAVGNPGIANISNPTSQTTDVTNLEPGVYTFRVQMKDNNNATISDTVVVTVTTPPQAPVKKLPFRFKLNRRFTNN